MLLRIFNTAFHAAILLIQLGIFKAKLVSPARYGKWLARRIERMGGIYLKIGQLLSVRPDIISFEVAEQLYPLLQYLKPVPFQQVKEIIDKSLAPDVRKKIDHIEVDALATASIAQVHKVLLTNGNEAVIKILKPSVKRHFSIDLKMFRLFMKAGSYIPGVKQMPVKQLAIEIDSLLRGQLDLAEEANNLLDVQKNFKEMPSLTIPVLHPEFICSDLLLMEYVSLPGKIDFTAWQPHKRMIVAQKALHIIYQMMFRDGLTHCDLHPGNFFVTGEGNFILLDFGMMTRMNREFRSQFIRFFFYMATDNSKGCAEIIEKTALHKSNKFDRDKLYREVDLFISEFSKLDAENFSVLAFAKKLIRIERKCGIKGATDFINNILAIAFFESQLKNIDPGIDFQEEAAIYIVRNVPEIVDIIK